MRIPVHRGKPDAVICCRTRAPGNTKCSIKSDASECRAPRGGSACVSLLSSCCDARTETGCESPAPSPTPTAPPPTLSSIEDDAVSLPHGEPPTADDDSRSRPKGAQGRAAHELSAQILGTA
jgi:hypothetical protein